MVVSQLALRQSGSGYSCLFLPPILMPEERHHHTHIHIQFGHRALMTLLAHTLALDLHIEYGH